MRAVTSNRVLIGYSSYFASKEYFVRKVSRLLSELDDYQVVSINDERGFISSTFENRVVEKVGLRGMSPRDVRKTVSSVSYVILFWDGLDLSDYVYYALFLKKQARIIPVETTKVVNRDKSEKFDVYIGRGSPWGNPFPIGKDGDTREEVIEKFRTYFETEFLKDENKRLALYSLRGKTLGCHCKPAACHGDVIAEYLNSLEVTASDQEEQVDVDIQTRFVATS